MFFLLVSVGLQICKGFDRYLNTDVEIICLKGLFLNNFRHEAQISQVYVSRRCKEDQETTPKHEIISYNLS